MLGISKEMLGISKEKLGFSKDFLGGFVGFQGVAREKKKKTLRPNFLIRDGSEISRGFSDFRKIARVRSIAKQKPIRRRS
jgi:hypothetical protein